MKSYYDLLDPRFKDRIVMMDPTITGKSQKTMSILGARTGLGWDYFKELVKQNPVLTRNGRLQLEWIANKKYLIGIAPNEGMLVEFKVAGAPIKVLSALREVIPWLSASTGGLSLMNRAPHPDAAKVFINWLLDREGQEIWSKTSITQSARTEVDISHMIEAGKAIREQGVSYYLADTEQELLLSLEWRKNMVEIFGPLLK